MATTTTTFSKTLQSLTQSKIRELEKQRIAYESSKSRVLAAAAHQTDPRDRVACILQGLKALRSDDDNARDSKTANIERWLNQARYDSSIPEAKLDSFQEHLVAKLDAHSMRLNIADLYSRLLTEWMDLSPSSPGSDQIPNEEEDYLVVEERQKQRLQQLCDQFERVVFEPLETDEDEIHAFLDGLFPDDDSRIALDKLREKVGRNCSELWHKTDPFNIYSIRSCIRGLLTEDLLSEEKQGILKYCLENNVALTEIVDVLNMRYADLKNWDWHAEDGIPVLPRQQLNGKYRIWIDDDVLQTIFAQYIAVRLCSMIKAILKEFIEKKSVWNWRPSPRMTERDGLRRQFYLSDYDRISNIETSRKNDYLESDFLFHMPLTETSLSERGMLYDDENNEDSADSSIDGPSNMKQQLLRKVASQILLERQIYGQAAVVQSDMKWYATALPHSTILAVMRFFGFPAEWLAFFQKYLAAPLNLDHSAEGRMHTGPRARRRGVPISHAMEKLTGELVLFPMDLAVNRETGLLLYRIHDDLWVCGKPDKCARAWEVMQEYAQVTGLEFNRGKTGSVYLTDNLDPEIAARLPTGPVTFGFLTLNAKSETWEIDQAQVDAHVSQLRKQLSRCDSVISWVRTWNSCIGRFFKNTFGQPAHCFGRAHIDAILSTYGKMQNTLFNGVSDQSGNTVTEHLRRKIESQFGVSDIPDAFFFLPAELGGLGLRNPFISVLLMRDSVELSPIERIERFKRTERESYAFAKKTFSETSEKTRRRRAETINPRPKSGEPLVITEAEINTFMSFEEYTRYRESRSNSLRLLYEDLMVVPYTKLIQITQDCRDALDAVSGQFRLSRQGPEVKWILQLYSDDVLKRFGGMTLVEKRFLPVGVLAMMKEKRVKWNMVL
ncbi:hypothetical protein ABOM_003158 [Aspergillus bombycis]|uniref:Reverse transcriptase domain-containing protein n=1 Tax=Aspergillus bombycis TaxID=109264 RepID=A0A1F8ABY2_9EURO|nr:hypothetical protein ABOM_003158 [Aspergillus bombycis]OGM48909.1 hypothetical protein ABOM_003158 [Aspergillus bombycis]